MYDYISRQAAIKAIHEEFDECLVWDESGQHTADEVESILTSLPSADAVEVVRCKDCKWYKTNYSWNGKEHKVCVIEPYEPVRKGDDFCSMGERSDG